MFFIEIHRNNKIIKFTLLTTYIVLIRSRYPIVFDIKYDPYKFYDYTILCNIIKLIKPTIKKL